MTDPGRVPSPCTGVCRLDPRTQCCDGCARTLDEIAAWSSLTDAARRTVLAALPARRLARRKGAASGGVEPQRRSPATDD